MKQIVKQPNGQLALVDFKDGTFIMENATVEEIRDYCVAKATRQVDSDIIGGFYRRSKRFAGNDDPFFQYAQELRESGVQG